MTPFVYIAGPITPTDGRTLEQNIDQARQAYYILVRAGVPCYCPHIHAADPEAFGVPYEAWMAHDKYFLDRATHFLVLPNHQRSKGTLREIAYWRGLQRSGGFVWTNAHDLAKALTL